MIWKRKVLDTNDYGQVLSSIGVCHSEDSKLFLAAIGTLDGVAVILACYQAYRSRNAETDLNESKYIGMAMVCIFQSFFFGVPLIIMSRGHSSTWVYVCSSIIFVVCVSVLLFTFLPLMIRENNRNVSRVAGIRHCGLRPRLRRLRAEQREQRSRLGEADRNNGIEADENVNIMRQKVYGTSKESSKDLSYVNHEELLQGNLAESRTCL